MCARLLSNIVFFAALFLFVFAANIGVLSHFESELVKRAFAQTEEANVADQSEEAYGEGVVDEGDPEAAKLAESQLDALNGQIRGVAQSLAQAEMAHFGIIYSNYTIYSMVKAVRSDIEGAVNACIEKNPEMEDQIVKRWNAWNKSVGATMKEAHANIMAMTLAQDYAPKENMENIFSLVDATREANSSRFETIPADTPEACEFMLSKMDETQEQMNMMLVATIKSYPAIMKKMQE